ncbi:MAG: hypothetical protein ACI9X4_000508 [Glaciecola sp.]|jgi:hypothetical protein
MQEELRSNIWRGLVWGSIQWHARLLRIFTHPEAILSKDPATSRSFQQPDYEALAGFLAGPFGDSRPGNAAS